MATTPSLAGLVRSVAGPIVRTTLRPPLIATRYQPATLLSEALERGKQVQAQVVAEATRRAVPMMLATVNALLDQMDLTTVVVQRVDLNRVAAELDVDAVAARLDLVPVVDRVPIDRILDRVDIDAIARRIDVDAIVDRVDLNEVAKRIDVDAIAAHLDIDAVVARVDLIGLARYVIEAIDLPEIIRSSSGSIASDAVRVMRMQSINADSQINRVADKIRLRRRAHTTQGLESTDLDQAEHRDG